MASRIDRLFARLREERRKGLIGYLTAGDPSPDRTAALAGAMVRGGVDLVELGVPFSDPIADGPVIQRASERALRAGTTLRRVLEIAAAIRRDSEVPLLLFSYLNPVVKFGLEALASEAVRCGIDGVLLTDLSVEEAARYTTPLRAAGLDTVFLAAPTSTEARLRLIAEHSTGFLYLVSRTGVTGARASLSEAVAPLAAAARKLTSLPLAVGFGVSTAEHVAEVGRVADAAVVGSAFVKLIEENGTSPRLESQLECLAQELRRGFDAVKS